MYTPPHSSPPDTHCFIHSSETLECIINAFYGLNNSDCEDVPYAIRKYERFELEQVSNEINKFIILNHLNYEAPQHFYHQIEMYLEEIYSTRYNICLTGIGIVDENNACIYYVIPTTT